MGRRPVQPLPGERARRRHVDGEERADPAEALRGRGVADPAAALAAETGVTIFRVGFETWIGGSSTDLAGCIRETLDELKTLTAAV